MSNPTDIKDGNSNATTPIAVLDSKQSAQQFLEQKKAELRQIDIIKQPLLWAKKQLDVADGLLATEQKSEAWQTARENFDVLIQHEAWQEAVEACNVMYQSEQAASLSALGQGLWLAITYPIEAETTVAMLHHVVDDTPKNADGAAVAAATAHYIAKLRTTDQKQKNLSFLTTHILGEVAKRHSNVNSQDDFNIWLTQLQLDKPELLLPRMAQIIDIMVENNWWFDRDELRAKLPVN